MNDADGFRLEAAEQFGAQTDADCVTYTFEEGQLIAFAKACERKGMAQAVETLEGADSAVALEWAVNTFKLCMQEIDAELAPIMETERQRCLAAKPIAPVPVSDAPTPSTILSSDAAPVATESREYWCVVALDYDKDEAWILDRSTDVSCFDLLDGSSGDDNGLMQDWVKAAVPGLYQLDLTPWGHQSYEGEWDTGVDVEKATLLVAFPDRLLEPTAPVHATTCEGGNPITSEPCDICGATDDDLCGRAA